MRKSIPVLLAAAAASLGAAGCESDSYSPAIRYGFRADPLVLKKPTDEQIEPDRPGVLPLLSSKDLLDPFNPWFPRGKDKDGKPLGPKEQFQNGNLRDPNLISKKDRRIIEETLLDMFGTPASPQVAVSTDIQEVLKLQEKNLKRGSSLYRVNCLHCHGVTGDGRGPTARWINPHPRDYRQRIFKFTSVDLTKGDKAPPPRREDLYRVLHHGIEGTAMPSFALLGDADLQDLVSYVIHLSLRGKVEFDTIDGGFLYDAEKNTLTVGEQPLDDMMAGLLKTQSEAWAAWQGRDKAIQVAPYNLDESDPQKLNDSIVRGYRLFKGEGSDKPGPTTVSEQEATVAKCISCHTSFGRQAQYKFDDWGTLTKARDLTQGVFRGGRRPVDIYYRIHSGISGSGMNPFGGNFENKERIWDLVNFVRAMPYPLMLKKLDIVLD
jgi:mono/diheme cytochrome c family protein